MSRKSIAEYVADKRRAYAQAGSVKRSRLLDDTCETLGYTRKYVIKLLTGNILYQQFVRRLKRILRRQEIWREQRREAQRIVKEHRPPPKSRQHT